MKPRAKSNKRRLAALVDGGYTIRKGVYIPQRGFPRWSWQLFTPAGEFVETVRGDVCRKMIDEGLAQYRNDGIILHQEATR